MATVVPAWVEHFARLFGPRVRRYPTPGALAKALDPSVRTSPALELIDAELVDLMDGDTHDGLMIFMASQEGKSEKVSRRFSEWVLDWNPALRVVDISYELDLAVRWGREVKLDIATHPCKAEGEEREDCQRPCGGLHIAIRSDSAAAGRWDTRAGGGMYCVGIGGPFTGKPVDVLLIDDPVKDRADAESQKMRERAWGWWESVAIPRLGTGAKVVLIMTRWHEDDLAGRILSRPGPLRWKVLRIPAIAEDGGDPLGRAPGEELPSIRDRAAGHFHRLQATLSRYVFAGIYQGKPTAAEGNFFRRPTFRYWRPLEAWPDGRERIDLETQPVTLADCARFATADLAVSKKDTAHWTVISVWAISLAGDLILLDRVRDRVSDHDHFGLAAPLAARWGFDLLYVESNYWSTTLVQDARAAGWAVAPVAADADKMTRAIPAAGRVHAGKVWWPAEAPWLDEWCDELAEFPNGTYDDQVDTLSYAAKVVTSTWVPAATPPRQGLTPHERAVATAHAAATGGDGHRGDLDIMRLPF